MRHLGLLIAALFLAPTAWAQEEMCSPYDHATWLQEMDQVDAALAEFDLQAARRQIAATQKVVRCLDALVKPSYLARFGRQVALIYFFDQDEDATRRWGLLARYADSELPWSEDFPPDHPFRQALEFAEDPVLGGPEGKDLAHPSKGGIFLNGHFLPEPVAHAEVPGLIQMLDKKGELLYTAWQDGAAFPVELLVEDTGKAPTPPKWFVPSGSGAPTMADGPVASIPGPATPPGPAKPAAGIKKGPVFLAGGLALGAGAVYALGALSRGGLDKAQTQQQLAAARTRTNLLVVGAGVTGAAAVGLGVMAFVSDEGAVVGLTGRF